MRHRVESKRGGRLTGLAALLVLAMAPQAGAATVSDSDRQCLACHSMAGLSKTLGDGDSLPLYVSQDAFSASIHARLGCASCHTGVDLSEHPRPSSIASRHEYSVARSGICRNCHRDIFDAYAGSMHGRARIDSGHAGAPICADCHQAHEVQAVAAGDRLRGACLGCHPGAPAAHGQWLPNSALHLDAVSCPACHSPTADRGVDLRLYDNGNKALVTETASGRKFAEMARAIDTHGDGLDALELWRLVREARLQGVALDVGLRGRLEVRSGADAHRLAMKLEAVRDCETCHEHGASPYRNVTVSVGAEDGRRIRYAATGEALTSAVSVDAIGNFYTAGGTRIGLLDWLLVLAAVTGLAIPATHMAIRWLFRNKR